MQRESINVDIVCVGAGLASLSTALRLRRRALSDGVDAPSILVIEKGPWVGAHVLSGAVLDPGPLSELLTDEERERMPVMSHVEKEFYAFLTRRAAWRLPWIPPTLRAKGYPLVSLSAVTRFFGGLCEDAGIEVVTGFTAMKFVRRDGRIAGVRVGDKGVGRDGQPKASFEPGPDILAHAVVLGEGGAGTLTEQLISDGVIPAGQNPQTYALGLKEVYELPARPGRAGTILHSFGFPLDARTYGGGFVYGMDASHVAVGLVVALDYRDAALDPHHLFRTFKAHPRIQRELAGGQVVAYGAKTIPEGGFFSVPGLAADGVVVVGDSGGLVDVLRIKGAHIAIQSGIAAGDALYESWRAHDFSATALSAYPRALRAMSGWKQMRKVRNVRAAFALGRLPGLAAVGLSVFSGGLLPPGRLRMGTDAEAMKPLRPTRRTAPDPTADPATQFDRLTDLFHSGTRHEEDQPCHAQIVDPARCAAECIPTFGAPCTLFCPAEVYTLAEGAQQIEVHPANCVHCRTCQNKDPLGNIKWVPPEGGGGPRYSLL